MLDPWNPARSLYMIFLPAWVMQWSHESSMSMMNVQLVCTQLLLLQFEFVSLLDWRGIGVFWASPTLSLAQREHKQRKLRILLLLIKMLIPGLAWLPSNHLPSSLVSCSDHMIVMSMMNVQLVCTQPAAAAAVWVCNFACLKGRLGCPELHPLFWHRRNIP